MKPLAAKLTAPFYGLQCSADVPLTSMTDLAEYYLRKIKNVQQTGPYIIAGYSFGAAVAFEMGTLLERAGERVTLVMIDGSPKYMSWAMRLFQQHANTANDENGDGDSSISQDTVIAMTFILMIFDTNNFDYAQTMKDLDDIATLDLKLKHVAEMVAQTTKFTADTVHLAAVSFSKKIKASINYKPKRKLTAASNAILFKTSDHDGNLSSDYGLSEVNLFRNVNKWYYIPIGET